MGSAEEAMLKISSSRDEVIEKVKAFLGAMAEGSGADEGAAPGVETPPPERARLGDRAIPADRLVRLSALVSVALNEKASDKEAPEQGDRTIGALITAPVAAPVPRFLQAGLVSTRPVEPRGARTQKGGKKRKAAKEPKEKKEREHRPTRKAALNMATVNMALELRRKDVYAVALHPGTTDTGLSEPFQANVKPEKLFTPEYSASSMLDVLEKLTPEDTGSFFAYDGSRIEF